MVFYDNFVVSIVFLVDNLTNTFYTKNRICINGVIVMNDLSDFEAIKKESMHLFPHPTPSAKKAYFYALEMAYWEIDGNFSTTLSKNNAFLLLLVSKGTGNLCYQEKNFHLSEGDLLLISCKENPPPVIRSTNGWVLFFLYFNGKQAKENYNIIYNKYKKQIFHLKNTSTILMLLWQILTLHEQNSPQAEAITSLNITKIITELTFSEQNPNSNAFYPASIHCVFHYVAHNYNKKITLDQLAAISSISKFHLSKEFKKYTGITISEYIIVTRLNQAKELLRHSDKSIKEIAMEVGFSLPSHFTKTFHDREHMTPGEYRKQWIE